ncbi:MAG: hypothetical protein MUF54_07340 [Polyangiaceae bacterium]|jgi:hypothetical protein|nr:hypothetical protein [Polyangiaceae bacterium]
MSIAASVCRSPDWSAFASGRLPGWAAQRLRDATGQKLGVWADRVLVASSMEEGFERG